MATALAFPLSDNGHEVRLIGTHLDREIIDSIKERRVHPGLDLEVPRAVRAFQLEEAEEAFDGADVVMSGVNSFGVRWAGTSCQAARAGMHVLSIAKGMEATESGDLRILPEVLAGEVPEGLREQVSWSAIAGPPSPAKSPSEGHVRGLHRPRRRRVGGDGGPLPYPLLSCVDLDRPRRRRGVRGGQELLRSRGRFHGGHTRPRGRVGGALPQL